MIEAFNRTTEAIVAIEKGAPISPSVSQSVLPNPTTVISIDDETENVTTLRKPSLARRTGGKSKFSYLI